MRLSGDRASVVPARLCSKHSVSALVSTCVGCTLHGRERFHLAAATALTTFSVAKDVAKYFAIIPAMLIGAFPQIAPLNVMGLGSPSSAILSAVIFNALIIIFLVPLALRGVKFRRSSAGDILRRNLLVFGLGGLVV